MKKIIFTSIICLLLASCSGKKNINTQFSHNFSNQELRYVGSLIYKNEIGNNRQNLVFWNPNESFPSLGIGHFVWYPAGYNKSNTDTLPKLVSFYKSKGIDVPKVLQNRYAPWTNRQQLEQARSRGEIEHVIEFFERTKDVQILFIYERLKSSLPQMMLSSDNPELVKYQFDRVATAKNGLYPLIDYVNFKGEGLNTSKAYNDVGWGLRQILEDLDGSKSSTALNEFADSCTKILKKRVRNQPRGKNEEVFLPGWIKRCQSYAF